MSRITLDVPEALHRQIKVEAAQRGISIREYLLRALEVRRDAGTEPPRRTFSDSGLAGLWADRDDLRDPAQWLEAQRTDREFDTQAEPR